MYQRVKPMKPKRVHKRPSRGLLLWSGVAIVAIIALAVATALSLQPAANTPPAVSYAPVKTPVATAVGTHEPVSPGAPSTAQAVASFKYLTNPPTSGPYLASSWPSAFSVSQPLPVGMLVHLLATGNVVVAYGPTSPQQIVSMRAFAQAVDQGVSVSQRAKAGEGVFVTPWPSLQPGQVALVAWSRLWETTGFNQSDATLFADTFLGNQKNIAQK